MPFFLQRLSELFEKNIGYEEVLSRKFPFLRDLGIISNPFYIEWLIFITSQNNIKTNKFDSYK